ncbi:MAG: DUF2807 domain-containing protein [Flavipsychrobacter sp.]|nr:DUF2807 domain-containing protein [Flavipsychrobacter sp.]
MKRIVTFSAIVLSTAVLFGSCRKNSMVGRGSVESETRTLSSFTSIEANGSTDIEIYASNTNKVIVTGYGNLIPIYETEVHGKTLHLEFKEGYWNIRNNNIKVTVYTTDMNAIHLNGSGNVNIHEDMNAHSMEVDVNGSGNIYIDNNKFDNFDCKINGSGNVKARAAECDDVYAKISGSGDIEITVNDLLDARISGSGDIDYWGSPEVVNTDVSGSGKVTKRN